MLKLIFPFMAGIVAGVFYPADNLWFIFGGLALLLAAMLYLAYFKLKRTKWYLPVFCICFAFVGYSVVSVHQLQRSIGNDFSHFASNDYCWAEVVIKEMPTQSAKSFKAMADVNKIQDSSGWHKVSGKAMLFFAKDTLAPRLHYGDKVLIYAQLREVSPPQNPYQFDYRTYLQRKGIYYQSYLTTEQYKVLRPSSEKSVRAVAYFLRAKMIDLIKSSGLSKNEQGIASALLLGWDEDVDDETLQSFSNAGIAHFLSISGLHLGIIFMFIGYMFFWMGNSRRSRMIRGIVQLAVLWFFAIVTGLSPSIMRAATMFSLITVGEMFFSRASFYNNLASSAFILLMFRPMLLFDVGFQLSYLGVVGIVVLQPRIKEIINIPEKLGAKDFLQNSWNQVFAESKTGKFIAKGLDAVANAALWLVQKVWELACVSIAAQIATLPLTFYYFHQFPVYFLIANVTVIPFAGFLLATVIFVVAFSWIPVVGGWIVKLLSLEITVITSVSSFVEKLPHSTISDFYFDRAMVLITALLIIGYAIALVKRNSKALLVAMAVSIVFVGYIGYVQWQKENQRQWIVYSTNKHLVMEFVDGNRSYFLSDSTVIAEPKSVEFSTQGYQRQNMTGTRVNVMLQDSYSDSLFYFNDNFGAFAGETFFLYTPENASVKSSVKPQVDYLVVSGNPRLKDVSELRDKFLFKQLIIASNNGQYRANKWQRQADSLHIPCHNVVADGAFQRVVK